MWHLPFMPDMGSFPRGTHIRTNRGDVAVERLAPGDRLLTSDGENATLRRIRVQKMRFVEGWPSGRPIVIRAGVLGGGLPVRDLVLPPGQRLAVADTEPVDLLARADLLVPVAGLTDLAGVRLMKGRRKLTLFSLYLDVPKLILAEGCLAESTPPFMTRLANRWSLGWSGVFGSRFRRADWPRALSIWQTRRLGARLQATGELPDRMPRHRENDVLEWDRDLEEERLLGLRREESAARDARVEGPAPARRAAG